MILLAALLVSNAWSQTTTSGSGFLPPELTLGAPQREQEINLIIGDRLTLDVREDHLELGSDMLSGIRSKRRSCKLLV